MAVVGKGAWDDTLPCGSHRVRRDQRRLRNRDHQYVTPAQIENPVVPWISGDHTVAVHLADTPRRSFTAGLQRLGGDPLVRDLVAALARWEDCARVVFARYNGEND